MPALLKKGSFFGNVAAEYVQGIEIGSYPKIIFAKQPTSSDGPSFGLRLSTVENNYFYKVSITFSRAVDFTKSTGKDIKIFGKKFSISPLTNNERIVLLGEDNIPLFFYNNGGGVLKGIDEGFIEGTSVMIEGGPIATTKIVLSIIAPDSDEDALTLTFPPARNVFIDPVFGTFRIDFKRLNIGEDDTSLREDFVIRNNGDSLMILRMKDYEGYEKAFQ